MSIRSLVGLALTPSLFALNLAKAKNAESEKQEMTEQMHNINWGSQQI